MQKKYLIAYIILSIVFKSYSQIDSAKVEDNKRFVDGLELGGNLGLQFGTYTFIDISPAVGYRVNESVTLGIGFTYIYYQYKDRYSDYNSSIYGGRVFGRYYFINNLFAQGEFEVLNLERFPNDRINVTNIFIGGGLRQAIGSSSYANFMILYNINDSPYSPYSNPIIRGGIAFGL